MGNEPLIKGTPIQYSVYFDYDYSKTIKMKVITEFGERQYIGFFTQLK